MQLLTTPAAIPGIITSIAWKALLFIATLSVFLLLWIALRIVRLLTSTLRGVRGPESPSFMYGHFKAMIGQGVVAWQVAMSKEFGRVFKFYGLLGNEVLYVSDPLALQHIVLRDQEIFERDPTFVNITHLAFGHNLLAAMGEHHRRQRKMLNPCFSVAHIKGLLPIFFSEAHKFREALTKFLTGSGPTIDIRQWTTRLSLEAIGRGGFGYAFESFNSNTNSVTEQYRNLIRDALVDRPIDPLLRMFSPYIMKLHPIPRNLLMKTVQTFAASSADTWDELLKMATHVYNTRKSEMGTAVEGRDIMSVLLRANRDSDMDDQLDEAELISQVNMFIIAGVHTTSTGLDQIFHTLALHPSSQTKLREEIIEVRKSYGGEDPTHEQLAALPYLDAVVRETLRLYTPLAWTPRTTARETSLPLSTPLISTTGSQLTHLHIKKNTDVIVGIRVANQDPLIWGPDAEEWKPERWVGRKFSEVPSEKLPGIYSGMMTFLGGSRACIGFKFSELEIKATVFTLLEHLQFLPAEKDCKPDITRSQGKGSMLNVVLV